MTDVIVEVLGGVVQNVAVNRKKVRVVLIDWDNRGESMASARRAGVVSSHWHTFFSPRDSGCL